MDLLRTGIRVQDIARQAEDKMHVITRPTAKTRITPKTLTYSASEPVVQPSRPYNYQKSKPIYPVTTASGSGAWSRSDPGEAQGLDYDPTRNP